MIDTKSPRSYLSPYTGRTQVTPFPAQVGDNYEELAKAARHLNGETYSELYSQLQDSELMFVFYGAYAEKHGVDSFHFEQTFSEDRYHSAVSSFGGELMQYDFRAVKREDAEQILKESLRPQQPPPKPRKSFWRLILSVFN